MYASIKQDKQVIFKRTKARSLLLPAHAAYWRQSPALPEHVPFACSALAQPAETKVSTLSHVPPKHAERPFLALVPIRLKYACPLLALIRSDSLHT